MAELVISSDSEVNEVGDEESAAEESKPVEATKKRYRKKKHRRTSDKLDEIDQSLKEINEMLGEPEQCLEVQPNRDLEEIKRKLFTVKQQFMDANLELNKKFGPDEEEDTKKRGRQPNLRRIAKKGTIIPSDKVFKKNGLCMKLKEKKNGLSYYVFDHSKNYQNMHLFFLYSQSDNSRLVWPLEESQERLHVEGMLETADRLYMMEEYAAGNKLIEHIISFMQYHAHPFFSVTNIRTRLEYKYVENRPFHIALLKYMHNLTNKACHRTALEIAKILLNLDSSDPLAVLFMIDIVALRAGEHQWLKEAIECWNEERDAKFMFNIQFSYALANYHLALKEKEKDPKYAKPKKTSIYEPMQIVLAKLTNFKYRGVKPNKDLLRPDDDKVGFENADELIQQAMLRFPTVLTSIMQNAGTRNLKINSSPLFNGEITNGISKKLKDLIILYAKLIWNKFTEESVLKWVIRNAEELVDKFATDKGLQIQAKEYFNININLFQTYPDEIVRHLSILTPISNLIVDGAVPNIGQVVSYNPAPPVNDCYGSSPVRSEETVSFFDIFGTLLSDAGFDWPEEISSGLSELDSMPSSSSDEHSSTLNSESNNEAHYLSISNIKTESVDDSDEEDSAINHIPIENSGHFPHELINHVNYAKLTQQSLALAMSVLNDESFPYDPESRPCIAITARTLDNLNEPDELELLSKIKEKFDIEIVEFNNTPCRCSLICCYSCHLVKNNFVVNEPPPPPLDNIQDYYENREDNNTDERGEDESMHESDDDENDCDELEDSDAENDDDEENNDEQEEDEEEEKEDHEDEEWMEEDDAAVEQNI